MASWTERCPVCNEPLPERGNRRVPIPRLGGRRRLVHPACADLVERQARLEVDTAKGGEAA